MRKVREDLESLQKNHKGGRSLSLTLTEASRKTGHNSRGDKDAYREVVGGSHEEGFNSLHFDDSPLMNDNRMSNRVKPHSFNALKKRATNGSSLDTENAAIE